MPVHVPLAPLPLSRVFSTAILGRSLLKLHLITGVGGRGWFRVIPLYKSVKMFIFSVLVVSIIDYRYQGEAEDNLSRLPRGWPSRERDAGSLSPRARVCRPAAFARPNPLASRPRANIGEHLLQRMCIRPRIFSVPNPRWPPGRWIRSTSPPFGGNRRPAVSLGIETAGLSAAGIHRRAPAPADVNSSADIFLSESAGRSAAGARKNPRPAGGWPRTL